MISYTLGAFSNKAKCSADDEYSPSSLGARKRRSHNKSGPPYTEARNETLVRACGFAVVRRFRDPPGFLTISAGPGSTRIGDASSRSLRPSERGEAVVRIRGTGRSFGAGTRWAGRRAQHLPSFLFAF